MQPHAPPQAEFRRLVDEAAETIAAHLETAAGPGSAEGLHEARKAIKTLRAMLRLAREANSRTIRREEKRLRDAARLVSARREATAAIETLDRFIRDHPRRIVEARLGEIRAALIRRGETIAATHGDEAPRRAARLVREAAARLAETDLVSVDDEILGKGMKKTLRRWKAALAQARDRGEAEDFHDLRKAVKAHAAQLAILRDRLPSSLAARRAATDALGERLGDFNDIQVMREAIAGGRLEFGRDIDLRPFDDMMKRKARKLRRRILADAGDLQRSRPRKPGILPVKG